MTSTAVERRAGNLPAEVTRFIGRRHELVQARSMLERSRLVTLLGVGGVGKTRLALRLAADLQRAFPDGVWLVELSALRDAGLVPRTVAEALHLPDRAEGEQLDMLVDYLADRQSLLVLDTCEHLVDACALLSEVLLRAAPRLRILATSRQPLEVMGEHAYQIPPLDAPEPGIEVPDADSLVLFTDRAESVLPGFTLTDHNRRSVARLCHRLDGIPLAIELAAVRLRTMSLEQIDERLDDRFRLLGSARTSRTRHQTLRAAVQWSHELCTGEEQVLWARLAVFPGGFDLAAAEQICADDTLPAGPLFDVLSRLVEKSIVLCDTGTGRYLLLDTIREYGAERLGELDALDDLRRRHRDHYLAVAERAAAAGMSAEQLPELARIRQEHHNIRVALDRSLSVPGDEHLALRTVGALNHYWVAAGLFSEGRGWLTRALAAVPETSPDRGRATCAAAILASLQGDIDAGGTLAKEAARIAAAHDDPELDALAVQVGALVAFCSGDLQAAREGFEEALSAYRAVGFHQPYALAAFHHLAAAEALLGEFDRSLAISEECLRVSAACGEQWGESFAIYTRAVVHWLTGNLDVALADAQACLRVKESADDLLGIAISLDLIAGCLAQQGDRERAVLLVGATDRMWATMRAPMMGPQYTEIRQTVLDDIRQALGPASYAARTQSGAALTIAEAIAAARNEPDGGEAAAQVAEPLTPREREVAALLAQGLSNREIGERLVIAKRTVDSHVEHILAKLGYGSRSQIAAWQGRRALGS